MKGEKKPVTKIGFNMQNETVAKVDEFAESLGITRTAAISVLVYQALEYREIVGMVGTLPALMDRAEKLKQEKAN